MKYGFIKVATATPLVRVADVEANVLEIEKLMLRAEGQGVEILCFPELSVTSYTCQDLFMQQVLIDAAEKALLKLLELSRSLNLTTIVGLPIVHRGMLFNCAAVLQGGKLQALIPKTYLPNYGEFYEQRWFASASVLQENEYYQFYGQKVCFSTHLLFEQDNCRFGVEICEDLFAAVAPSTHLALQGAEVVFNLSASNEVVGKQSEIKQIIAAQSRTTHTAYVYSSCGFGESTQDLVFSGRSLIYENGELLAEGERFQPKSTLLITELDTERLRAERLRNTTFMQSVARETAQGLYAVLRLENQQTDRKDYAFTRKVEAFPFLPPTATEKANTYSEIFAIQTQALATRMHHLACKKIVLGISGGLDSTLALLVAVATFKFLDLPLKGIIGLTMPGFGTSARTYENACLLMKKLGITVREIPIVEAVAQHFQDIDHDPNQHDVTFENAQARERTQILMDVANQNNALVLGTGDLSELALGWATYNGDHMSMYGVNASLPKTLIQDLVRWIAENSEGEESNKTEPSVEQLLLDIVHTPISPELTPTNEIGEIAQKTENLVGPYPLHDFFLYYTLRYGFRPQKIFFLAKQAFGNSQSPFHQDENSIAHWMSVFFRRFFVQQFKRSCLPDGPKVTLCSLSPRGDWRMPSDAQAKEWLRECESLLA